METRELRTPACGALRWLPLCFLVCSAAALSCGDDDAGASGQAAAGASSGRAGATSDTPKAGRSAAGSGGSGASGRGAAGHTGADSDAGAADDFSFFVTSDTSKTGDLGGLAGADKRCQDLASAVGAGSKTWHAYLSAARAADGGGAVHARDRIGDGPWFNVKGSMLAKDSAELHARNGDAELFLDEHGAKINGQWLGSPTPNEHDVFTGSNADGTLLDGKTCQDWTSTSVDDKAQVGHTDGLGPMQNPAPPYNSWSSVHENGGCNDTAPRGGAGKLYCFAID